MAQNHLRADGQHPPSTFSSRSDYGSGFDPEAANGSHNMAPVSAYGAPMGAGGQAGVMLPPSVKYPPSYYPRQQQQQQQQQHSRMLKGHHQPRPNYPPPQPRPVAMPPPTAGGHGGVANVSQAPPIIPSSASSDMMSDVIRQLDMAADENSRLRQRLQENNRILEERVQDIERGLESRNKEKKALQEQVRTLQSRLQEAEKAQKEEGQGRSMPSDMGNKVDETTNRFFEARVAVMGFKCRVMQLQGELNDLHKKGPADAVARGEIERLKEENQSLRTDLTRAREEADAARRQAQQAQLSQQARQSTVSGSRHEKELNKRCQDLGGQILSQELVIKEVNQQLTDKRALFASETQRMHQQSQQLQAEMQRMRAEVQRVQNQLAHQQQSSEQQLTSLNTQLNMARQEQARTQEVGRQLSVSHAEMSRLRSDLDQAREETEKYKKKSEVFETRVKESTSKMMTMEGKLKSSPKSTPVPKPRGDLTQLKTEKEQLETHIAMARSGMEREKAARERLEAELYAEQEKNQALLIKNGQLQNQLGSGGAGGGEGIVEELRSVKASLEEANQRLEQRASEAEGRAREKAEELRTVQEELVQLQYEKARNQETIDSLEKERKEAVDAKVELGTRLAILEQEKTTLEEKSSSVKSTDGKKPKTGDKGRLPSTEQRLNDTVGKLKSLEARFEEEKRAKAKVEKELTEEKERFQELQKQKQELDREKAHLEGETIRGIQEQRGHVEHQLREKEGEVVSLRVRHQEDLDRLRAELSTQKQNYERKIYEKENTLKLREKDLGDIQQSLRVSETEKEGELQSLRQRWHLESQQKEEVISQVRQELQSNLSQLHTIHAENETLRANNSQISTRMRDTQRDSEHFKQELTSTQQMAENFQKEAQSLVADYQDAGRQIESLKEERDRYRGQAEMGVRELAQRGERIKALERERKVLEEQQQHMDLQLKQYMADFRNEREAREGALQVKEMAERKQHQLSTEVSTLQRQLTEIQRVQHIDSEIDEPNRPTVAGVGAMGGREGGRPDAWSATPVGGGRLSTDPQTPPHSQQSRSGDQSRSPYARAGEPGGVNPPPIPPKPGPAGEYHPNVPNPSLQQQFVGGGGVGHMTTPGVPPREYSSAHPQQELVTPQTVQFPQNHLPAVSQPPSNMAGGAHMGAGGYVRREGAGIPMDPHTRAREQMGVQPGAMRPRSNVNIPAGPSQNSPIPAPRPGRAPEPGGGGNAWVGPGEIVNQNRPVTGCPLCSRNDFATVTDLEIHCAQCTGTS